MATTDDARAGWELYRNSGFSLSLEEINDRLKRLGFAPVAERTYNHYHRLRRRGFRRYVTINRLDTMNVPDPFEDESIRNHYTFAQANVPAQLILQRPGQPIEILGRADALSELGAEFVIDDPLQASALRELGDLAGTPVTVNFLSPAETAYGTVDFVDTLLPETRIAVLFQRLVPVFQFVEYATLDASRFRFVVGVGEAEVQLDVVSRDVYWLFQAVETARAITNTLLDALAPSPTVSPVPIVERLSVASPMDSILKVSVHVYLQIERLANHFKTAEKAVKGAVQTASKAELTKAEAADKRASASLKRAQADQIRTAIEGMKIDNEIKAIARDVLSATADSLISTLHTEQLPTAGEDLNVERLSILFTQLNRSVGELTTRGLELGPAPPNQTGDK